MHGCVAIGGSLMVGTQKDLHREDAEAEGVAPGKANRKTMVFGGSDGAPMTGGDGGEVL
jgi:hypothetical protein